MNIVVYAVPLQSVPAQVVTVAEIGGMGAYETAANLIPPRDEYCDPMVARRAM